MLYYCFPQPEHQNNLNATFFQFLVSRDEIKSSILFQTLNTSLASEAGDCEELTIEEMLNKLSLNEFADIFKKEQIDMDTLVNT